MKKHQFHKLCEGLTVHLPGFTVGGWLLIQAIDHGILRGFSCDPSEFDPDKFALVAFALPLFVPTRHVHFNFGFRLKDAGNRDRWWSLAESDLVTALLETIRSQGLPFLAGYNTPGQFANSFQKSGNEVDPYLREAVGFSHANHGDFSAALASLASLAGSLEAGIPWHAPIRSRVDLLADRIKTSQATVRHQLDATIVESRLNLGL